MEERKSSWTFGGNVNSYILLHIEVICVTPVTYSYIQSLDFLISFKLHPSLVAIRNMIPTFCLSKLSKVTSLLNEFNIIEFYSDYDAPQQQIHNKIEDFLKNGPKKMSTLGTKIKSVEKLSDDKIQKLKAEVLKAN